MAKMNFLKIIPKITLLLSFVAALSLLPQTALAAMKCYDCHGTKNTQDIRPEDASFRNPSSGGFIGSHRTHVAWGATPGSCARCHPGSQNYSSAHRNRMIYVSSGINLSRQVTTYNNRTTAWPQTAVAAPGQNANQCTNVNCHFERETLKWGSPPSLIDCSSCHTSPPSGGSHGKKHGDYFGNSTDSCSKCHVNHLADANTFSHATSAGKRGITVQFTAFPNTFGRYSGGSNSYPEYLIKSPEILPPRNGSCLDTYCHSDGQGQNGGRPVQNKTWSDTTTTKCYSCHRGRAQDSTAEECASFGLWTETSETRKFCTPYLTMTSNGHHRLVGTQWIRKYPCDYCHFDTVNSEGEIKDRTKHVNRVKNVVIKPVWRIFSTADNSNRYDLDGKRCLNIYCHSDGTTQPAAVRPFAWKEKQAGCNSCHGHRPGGENGCSSTGCHDGEVDPETGIKRSYQSAWSIGSEWKSAMPMYLNEGAGTARANSHPRHLMTSFTCDVCHAETIVQNGSCTSMLCHGSGTIPEGSMSEVSHLNGAVHVNKNKDVVFGAPASPAASYNNITKTCSGTGTNCHGSGTGADPVWGGSVSSAITCLGCHRTTGPDVDDFGNIMNGARAKINQQQWETTGHGRYSTSGHYPGSNNPAANFPSNPCWYCHDNSVFHLYSSNPFRLRIHIQYEKRFEKECVYCHMQRTDDECTGCHVGQAISLAPQSGANGITYKYKYQNLSTYFRYPTHTHTSGCLTTSGCHDRLSGTFPGGTYKSHYVNMTTVSVKEKADVKNQYVMMGVCLQCHDDDSGGQCVECHTAPANNPYKYALGFKPFVDAPFVKPKKARATSSHFGKKHYAAYKENGIWQGGKFCWDCHDPHGDSNIFMIHDKVATTTDGRFGIPTARADVTFVNKDSGTGYARKTAPFNGICNVCHSADSKHYTKSAGDGHNYSRPCTNCHEHRFSDSHANRQSCNSCHTSTKPIPKHTAFGLPRDCTKCHYGTIGKRMDVIGQMKSNSHHVQGVEVTNKHCYACHWESTKDGLIDLQHHTGYNYKLYTSVKNDYVDLVVWQPGTRPTAFREFSTIAGRATAARFMAANMGTPGERSEVGKITNHCLSCHSDQNNNSEPFGDYRTPRQYAWDYQSVGSRYAQKGLTSWGKYSTTATNKKKQLTKSFSAHGNAELNQGGWSSSTGYDGTIPITRGATGVARNIECFDCHNSHGSKVVGTTTSYTTFNGTNNGGNLKETKQNIGGYSYDYKASANTSGINPYGAGAGQCFDCHNSAANGTATPNGKTPWGYNTTFGATAPVMGYKDTNRFGQGTKGSTARFTERDMMKTIVGGHLGASFKLNSSLPHLAKAIGSATAGTGSSLTDGSKNWTADKWKNMYLQMTSGANSGQIRKIAANSGTTITLVDALTAVVASGDNYQIVPYSSQVNGLCTPCHDPHGVSQTLGDNQQFAVPLLKGSWLTSPYKEDQPPPDPTGNNVTNGPTGMPRSWGKYVTSNFNANIPQPTAPITRHYLDRNTLGGSTRISEKDDAFAGLCTNCHQKAALTDGTNKNQSWKTVDRIHESVKGWGANTEHSFTCSKCHQPHNSGLPKLMVTNCLDYKHRGNRQSGGQQWAADKQGSSNAHNIGGEHRGFPIGSMSYSGRNTTSTAFEATVSCHVGRFNPTYSPNTPPTQWPDGNLWNSVTPW